MVGTPTFLSLTPIVAGRADEFDEWIHTTVIATMEVQRPHLAGGAHVHRGLPDEDGVVTFAITFTGGSSLSDWYIWPFLADAIGEEAAKAEMQRLDEMCPAGQTSFALVPVADS